MRLCFLFLSVLFFHMQVYAQTQLMTVKAVNKKHVAALRGKSSVIFVSQYDDLVVDCPSSEHEKKAVKKNAKGEYEYEFLMDITQDNGFFYNIYKNELQAREGPLELKANECCYFYVSVTDDPILVEKSPVLGSELYANDKGESCVELITGLLGINVHASSKDLVRSIKRGKNIAGQNVISVVLDASVILQVEQNEKKYQELQEEKDVLETAASLAKTIAEMDSIDAQVAQKKEQLEKLEQSKMVAYLEIFRETSNVEQVNLLGLELSQPRMLKRFTVTPRERKVFESDYVQLFASAENAEKNIEFTQAKNLYQQALKIAKTEEEKIPCESKIALMDKCADYINKADTVLRVLRIRRQRQEEYGVAKVVECYNQAIGYYRAIYDLLHNEVFAKRVDILEKQVNNLPLIVEGRVIGVRVPKLGNGVLKETLLTDVDIYGISKDGKDIFLGKVNENGRFKLQFKKSEYDKLLFVYHDNKKDKKIDYQLKDQYTDLVVRFKD